MSHSPGNDNPMASDSTAVGLPDTGTLQAHKLEAIGRLAGGVAHDFNNVLTIIRGSAELLCSMIADRPKALELVEEILQASDRAAALTRQLLAFGRQQIVQPRVLDLNALIGNLANMLRRVLRDDIDFTTTLSLSPVAVKVDPGQIEQVLLNLCLNARDAMPRGGKLTIATQAHPAQDENPATVRLLVSDTGDGMDEVVKSRLFEPFFTTKDVGKGTGLGLATAYGIVQQCGGTIRVASELGQGTTFTIELPLVEEVPAPTPASKATPTLSSGTGTILLVEDEDPVRELVRRILEGCGYRVLMARHGPDALARCEKYRGPIDLLVTDVVMPGMTGPEMARQLALRYPRLRVLYMSGYNESEVVRNAVLSRRSGYLAKPFSGSELTKAVRAALK